VPPSLAVLPRLISLIDSEHRAYRGGGTFTLDA